MVFVVLNICNPVPLTPCEADRFALSVECCGCLHEEQRIDAFERVDADDSIEATVDAASDHRRDATVGTDVEMSGLCTKGVLRYE